MGKQAIQVWLQRDLISKDLSLQVIDAMPYIMNIKWQGFSWIF